MVIGILDYLKQKDERSSYTSPNAMGYNCFNCFKYPEKVVEGDGFKQGDTV